MTQPGETVYLIDASIYIFRSWFSLPDSLVSTQGKPVNAVYGFLRFVTEFLEETRPSNIVFAFDGSLASSFRNEILPEYKANRESSPQELKDQFELCRSLLSALGLHHLIDDCYEADDLIATVARRMRNLGYQCVIVSADKDLTQVVEGRDIWWDYSRNKRLTVNGVHERFGVWPHQISDYLALVGDSVDNIPGVPGVGPKSAARLLRLYPDLESIYDNLPQVSQLAIRGASRISANLREHNEQVFTARKLTTLVNEVPLKDDGERYRVGTADQRELGRLTELIDRGGGYIDRIKQTLSN